MSCAVCLSWFFFQAEDGIRDLTVTGVQTCALPICKGYLPGTQNRPEDAPIGLIPVDALFSPVRKVSYRVENTRVGQVTDYDSLSMRVETNGAMSPEDAVALAARILQDQLQLFINFE